MRTLKIEAVSISNKGRSDSVSFLYEECKNMKSRIELLEIIRHFYSDTLCYGSCLKFSARYLADEREDVGFKSHINDVICFHSEPFYGIAYLEQVYADILEKCRNGIPPVVTVQFPAFRKISPTMEKKHFTIAVNQGRSLGMRKDGREIRMICITYLSKSK